MPHKEQRIHIPVYLRIQEAFGKYCKCDFDLLKPELGQSKDVDTSGRSDLLGAGEGSLSVLDCVFSLTEKKYTSSSLFL